MKRIFIALIGLWFLALTAACLVKPEGPVKIQPGQSFELRPVEGMNTAVLEDQLSLKLVAVNDSRCPEGVLCVHAGWATLSLELEDSNGKQAFELRFGAAPEEEQTLSLGAYRLSVQDVQPYPVYEKTVPADQQIVTFVLEKQP